MTALASPRTRTAREIANSDYERLRPTVMNAIRSQLGRRGMHVEQLDLEAWYNAAWEALWMQLEAGKEVQNPEGFLVTVAGRRAIDQARRLLRGPARQLPLEPELHGVETDLEEMLDRKTLLRHLQEGLKEKLSYREWQAATLCLILGLSRPEAAQRLGLTRDQIERVMDSATVKIREFLPAIVNGEWCEQHQSTLRAYAMYVLDENGERYHHARAHLAGCPGCRRFVAELRHLYPALTPHPPLFAIAAAHLAGVGGLGHLLRRTASAIRRHAVVWKGGASVGAGASASVATGAGGGSVLIGGKLLAVCATLCLGAIIGSTATMRHHSEPKASHHHVGSTAQTTLHADESAYSHVAPAAPAPTATGNPALQSAIPHSGRNRASAAQRTTAASTKPVANDPTGNAQEFGFETTSGSPQRTAASKAPPPKAVIATRSSPAKQEFAQHSTAKASTATDATSTSPHPTQTGASAEFGYEGR